MFSQSPQLLCSLLLGLAILPASSTNVEAASQGPALKRIAKSLGRSLARRNRTSVRLIRGPSLSTETGKKLETAFVAVLKSDGGVKEISDKAQFGLKVDYVISKGRVRMEVILLDRRNESLGKFMANFDLDE